MAGLFPIARPSLIIDMRWWIFGLVLLTQAAALNASASSQASPTTSSLATTSSSSSQASSTASSSPTTTSSTGIATHSVTAGKDASYAFDPNSITANVGDVIEFAFYPSNHSVARSAYMTPCLPIGDTSPGEKEGFWSGFFPLQTGTEDVPKFRITVNDTAPIWFYCSAPGACIDDGMLGVVNPNSTQTLAVQQAYGKNSTIMLSPGEAIPPEGTTPSSTASPSTTSSRSSGLGGGAIAGIVVGGVAFLAVAGLAIYLFGRNHTLASILRYSQPRPSRSSNMPPLSYSAQDVPSPYSPGLETKEPMPSPEMSMPNNWQSAGYTSQTMSPENHSQAGDVYEGQGLMGSNILHKQFGQGHPQYTELDHQSQLQETHNPVRIQSSPGEAPWSPGGFGLSGRYTQVAPSEMGGEGISPGRPSPSAHGSYTAKTERRHDQDIGPHELDARPSVPETPQSPLDYDQASQHSSRRAFSFTEGSEAPPGVDKILQG